MLFSSGMSFMSTLVGSTSEGTLTIDVTLLTSLVTSLHWKANPQVLCTSTCVVSWFLSATISIVRSTVGDIFCFLVITVTGGLWNAVEVTFSVGAGVLSVKTFFRAAIIANLELVLQVTKVILTSSHFQLANTIAD